MNRRQREDHIDPHRLEMSRFFKVCIRTALSHHIPIPYLGASISQQLSDCVSLLHGRVGAGAYAVAKLAASVSCPSK